MTAQRIQLGPLSLLVAPGWAFFPTEKQIVGRSEARIGGLRISLSLLNSVPAPRTHEESLALVLAQAPKPDTKQECTEVHGWSDKRLVGAASYPAGNDWVRLYYVHEGANLLPLLYSCKLKRYKEDDAARELAACDMMVASIQFPFSSTDSTR
jgi:hypothetical protein